jgi:hypothetical protein
MRYDYNSFFQEADGDEAHLTIIGFSVLYSNRSSTKYDFIIAKVDAVLSHIGKSFGFIPFSPKHSVSTNVVAFNGCL